MNLELEEFKSAIKNFSEDFKKTKIVQESYTSKRNKRQEENFITERIVEILNDSTIGDVSRDIFLKVISEAIPENDVNRSIIDGFHKIDPIKTQQKYNGGKDKPDIVIKSDKDKKIFIENKILAEDQPNQLWRYSGHADILFYLTRYGHKASVNSEKPPVESKHKESLKPGKDYYCISYHKHIYNWLLQLSDKIVEEHEKVKDLLTWVRLMVVSCPDIFELILANRDRVEEILASGVADESSRIIINGCHEGDKDGIQGFVRFNNYVVWTKLFPALEKFAKKNGCELIVSDRFEFKNRYQYFIFQHRENPDVTVKFRLDQNRHDDTWNGVSVNGNELDHSLWDFKTLLNYDAKGGLLEEIIKKTKESLRLQNCN